MSGPVRTGDKKSSDAHDFLKRPLVQSKDQKSWNATASILARKINTQLITTALFHWHWPTIKGRISDFKVRLFVHARPILESFMK